MYLKVYLATESKPAHKRGKDKDLLVCVPVYSDTSQHLSSVLKMKQVSKQCRILTNATNKAWVAWEIT